ncbi:MAG: hypothetical protein GXN93_03320 [Candidatus Diapherotrites archaeon]|nr:hypothetical protein [Candidatus Diapherotrites archaeon]
MKIGFMTDIHYDHEWDDTQKQRLVDDINWMRSQNCDLYVFCGDILSYTNWGYHLKHRDRMNALREFFSFMGEDLPKTHWVPGNHDTPTDLTYQNVPQEVRRIHPYKLSAGRIDMFFLNTTPPGYTIEKGTPYRPSYHVARGFLPYTHLRWLLNAVEKAHAENRIIIVFSHHPLYRGGLTIVAGWLTLNREPALYNLLINSADVEEQIKEKGPLINFFGHIWPEDPGHATHGPNSDIWTVWKPHSEYHMGGGGTVSFIDIDEDSGRVVATMYSEDKSETTVYLDVTPNW